METTLKTQEPAQHYCYCPYSYTHTGLRLFDLAPTPGSNRLRKARLKYQPARCKFDKHAKPGDKMTFTTRPNKIPHERNPITITRCSSNSVLIKTSR